MQNQEYPNPVTPFHMQAGRPWDKLIINDFWGSAAGVQISDDENCYLIKITYAKAAYAELHKRRLRLYPHTSVLMVFSSILLWQHEFRAHQRSAKGKHKIKW